jgi:chromate transport protein ChrA
LHAAAGPGGATARHLRRLAAAGDPGGFAAGSFFVVSSVFVLLLLLSWLSVAYTDVPVIRGLLYGVQPVVMAIVLDACCVSASLRSNTPALRVRVGGVRFPVLP